MPHAWQQTKHTHHVSRDIIYRPVHVCDVLRPVVYMAHPPTKTRLALPRVIYRPAPVSVIRPGQVFIRRIVIIKIKNPPDGGFFLLLRCGGLSGDKKFMFFDGLFMV